MCVCIYLFFFFINLELKKKQQQQQQQKEMSAARLVITSRLPALSLDCIQETIDGSFMEPEFERQVNQSYGTLVHQTTSSEREQQQQQQQDTTISHVKSPTLRENMTVYMRQTPITQFAIHVKLFLAILLSIFGPNGHHFRKQKIATLMSILFTVTKYHTPHIHLLIRNLEILQQSMDVDLGVWARILAPALPPFKLYQVWFAQKNHMRYRYFEWVRADAAYLPENNRHVNRLQDMLQNPELDAAVQRVKTTQLPWSTIKCYFYTKRAIHKAIQDAGLLDVAKPKLVTSRNARHIHKDKYLQLLHQWQQNPPRELQVTVTRTTSPRYDNDISPIHHMDVNLFQNVPIPRRVREILDAHLFPCLSSTQEMLSLVDALEHLKQTIHDSNRMVDDLNRIVINQNQIMVHPLNRGRLPIQNQERAWQARHPEVIEKLGSLRISNENENENENEQVGHAQSSEKPTCTNVDPITRMDPEEMQMLPPHEIISFYINGKEPKHCIHRATLFEFWKTPNGKKQGNCIYAGTYNPDTEGNYPPASYDERSCSTFYMVPLPRFYISASSMSTLEQHPHIHEWDLLYDSEVYVELGVTINIQYTHSQRVTQEHIYQVQPHTT